MIVTNRFGARFNVVEQTDEWVRLRPVTVEAEITTSDFTISRKAFEQFFREAKDVQSVGRF